MFELTNCVLNEDRCLIEEVVDCPDGQICGIRQGEMLCVDPCEFIESCSGPTMCDGDDLVLCEPDRHGCYIETDRIHCAERDKTCDPEGGVCSGDELCGENIIQVNCNQPITVLDEQLQPGTTLHGYCNDLFDFEAEPAVFEIINTRNSLAGVRASISWDFEESETFLGLIALDGTLGMCIKSAECLDGFRLNRGSDREKFTVPQGSAYLVVDSISTLNEPIDYRISIECFAISCNDGRLRGFEQCEDGNTEDGDGCSSLCELEEGFTCYNDYSASPITSCRPTTCGDLHAQGFEQCEDGNTEDGDGCSSSCQFEPGFICGQTLESELYTCRPIVCGNGLRGSYEYCDDGNTEDGDGCSSSCEFEDGFICELDYESFPVSSCHLFMCGDGIIDDGEECEDGNIENNDGCSSSCEFEPGFICENNYESSPITNCHFLMCGDGIIDYNEECEDGNTENNDGCSSSCEFEDGFVCENDYEFSPITSCHFLMCGDGIIDDGEECDDGNLENEDGCSPDCLNETSWACETTFESTPNTYDCRRVICNDGIIDGEEECEDGNTEDGDGCSECYIEEGFDCASYHDLTSTCVPLNQGDICQNAIPLDEGSYSFHTANSENDYSLFECGFWDNQFSVPGSDMVFAITIPAYSNFHYRMFSDQEKRLFFSTTCENLTESCRDSFISYTDNSIDEVYFNHYDRERTIFLTISELNIENSEEFQLIIEFQTKICGDGLVAEGEDCDDGNREDYDGCSSSCEFEDESYWACYDDYFPVDMEADPPVPTTICRLITCGDGFIDRGYEFCDDGNLDDGDGCSAVCRYEGYEGYDFFCTTTRDPFVSPATECRGSVCGDSVLELKEQCDDGNDTSGDGCSDVCVIETDFSCTIVGEPCLELTQLGDGCFSPIPLEEGVGTTVYERTGFHNAYDVRDGADIVFSINVPNQTALHVTEHIIGDDTSVESLIVLFDSCPLIGDSFIDGRENQNGSFFTWGNNTGAELEVLLIVAGMFSEIDETQAFTMEVEFEPFECGDGNLMEGVELCDDGNLFDDDGCSADCYVEYGWACDNNDDPVCHIIICGDGWIEGYENCDDENTSNEDGCSSYCRVENGWECDQEEPSSCFPE